MYKQVRPSRNLPSSRPLKRKWESSSCRREYNPTVSSPKTLRQGRGGAMCLFRRLTILALWPGCLGVSHLLVLGVCGLLRLGRFAGLLLGLTLRCKSLLLRNPLALDLVEVTLHDGTRHGTDLINFRNVNRLGRVITLII